MTSFVGNTKTPTSFEIEEHFQRSLESHLLDLQKTLQIEPKELLSYENLLDKGAYSRWKFLYSLISTQNSFFFDQSDIENMDELEILNALRLLKRACKNKNEPEHIQISRFYHLQTRRDVASLPTQAKQELYQLIAMLLSRLSSHLRPMLFDFSLDQIHELEDSSRLLLFTLAYTKVLNVGSVQEKNQFDLLKLHPNKDTEPVLRAMANALNKYLTIEQRALLLGSMKSHFAILYLSARERKKCKLEGMPELDIDIKPLIEKIGPHVCSNPLKLPPLKTRKASLHELAHAYLFFAIHFEQSVPLASYFPSICSLPLLQGIIFQTISWIEALPKRVSLREDVLYYSSISLLKNLIGKDKIGPQEQELIDKEGKKKLERLHSLAQKKQQQELQELAQAFQKIWLQITEKASDPSYAAFLSTLYKMAIEPALKPTLAIQKAALHTSSPCKSPVGSIISSLGKLSENSHPIIPFIIKRLIPRLFSFFIEEYPFRKLPTHYTIDPQRLQHFALVSDQEKKYLFSITKTTDAELALKIFDHLPLDVLLKRSPELAKIMNQKIQNQHLSPFTSQKECFEHILNIIQQTIDKEIERINKKKGSLERKIHHEQKATIPRLKRAVERYLLTQEELSKHIECTESMLQALSSIQDRYKSKELKTKLFDLKQKADYNNILFKKSSNAIDAVRRKLSTLQAKKELLEEAQKTLILFSKNEELTLATEREDKALENILFAELENGMQKMIQEASNDLSLFIQRTQAAMMLRKELQKVAHDQYNASHC